MRIGIFPKVLVALLTLALLPAAGFGLLAIRSVREPLDRRTSAMLELRAAEIAERVQAFLQERVEDLGVAQALDDDAQAWLAFYRARRRPIWAAPEGADGRPVLQALPVYREITRIDGDGRERFRVRDGQIVPDGELRDLSTGTGSEYLTETYFQEARKLPPGELYVSPLTRWFSAKGDVEEARRLGVLRGGIDRPRSCAWYDGVFRFAQPIYRVPAGGGGLPRFDGVVVLSLDHCHLAELVQHVHPFKAAGVYKPVYKEGNYAYLFDHEGWTITHPKPWNMRGLDRGGNPVPPLSERSSEVDRSAGRTPINYSYLGYLNEANPRIVEDVRAGRAGLVDIASRAGFVKRRAYAPIEFRHGNLRHLGVFGGVMLGAKVERVERVADRIAERMLLLLIVLAAMLMPVAVFVSRRLTGPMVELAQAARRVGRGEQVNVARRSGDELGQLADAFNSMQQDLQGYQKSLVRAEKLATIGRFTAGIAHEIKNPLGGISNYLALLRRKVEAGTPAMRYAEAIATGVQHIDSIVKQLSDFKTEVQLQAAPLHDLVDDVMVLVEHRARKGEVEVQIDVPPELPLVWGDRNGLKQVLINLLVNGVDAMEGMPEERRLEIRARYAEADAQLVIEVQDHGEGISEERLGTIFEPFFTTKDSGTGLGLYISYEIVQAHRGSIDVQSRVGVGTTFTLRLPIAPESEQR